MMRYSIHSLLFPLMLACALPLYAEPVVRIETNLGVIRVDLDREKAPITVDNFITYINSRFYDNTLFHRVVKNFVIQGGGFDPSYNQKLTRPAIHNESDNGLANKRGSIAMARTSAPDSATSQFFINLSDNDFLNGTADKPGYAVFGNVIEGMDVVDSIARQATGMHPQLLADVPLKPIIIERIRLDVPVETAEVDASQAAQSQDNKETL